MGEAGKREGQEARRLGSQEAGKRGGWEARKLGGWKARKRRTRGQREQSNSKRWRTEKSLLFPE